MPKVIVISGANGSGKSTLAPYLLRDTFGIVEYVNADTIAQGLSAFASERAAFEAGKIMLKRISELAKLKKDLAFETTLASRFFANWIKKRQAAGYEFHLVFLYLQSAELAVERVRSRVRLGGHSISETVVRRRYLKGLQKFFALYRPLADSWRFYDASENPLLIASGEKDDKIKIAEAELWNEIQKIKE